MMTYHDQTLLHAKDRIAREEFISCRIHRRDKFTETWCFDHQMQVVRSHVVSTKVI